MIFLSHNYKDKPIVEHIALRLRDIFGQDEVFYDSWSIQPGDGIIDKMNTGIGNCSLFLFFVSRNSLNSKMVSLEWQNAVIKSTNGQTKLIPIKLDDCLMPPILFQSLYIDLFGQGIEIALRQIIDIAFGKNIFQVQHPSFSNLRAYKYNEENKIIIECHAEYYLEPISRFVFLTRNNRNDFSVICRDESPFESGFKDDFQLNNGEIYGACLLGVARGTLPGFPLILEATPLTNKVVDFLVVMHEVKKNSWSSIPLIQSRKS